MQNLHRTLHVKRIERSGSINKRLNKEDLSVQVSCICQKAVGLQGEQFI